MATSKPRITITLEPQAHQVLARLSELNGQSMSALVTGLLDVALPSLERTVLLHERLAAASEEARSGLAASLAKAEHELEPALRALVRQADMLLDLDPSDQAEVPARGGREAATGGRRRGSTPVPVTRGSGGPKAPAKAAKQPAKKGARRA